MTDGHGYVKSQCRDCSYEYIVCYMSKRDRGREKKNGEKLKRSKIERRERKKTKKERERE